MEIVTIFAPSLYAIQYEEADDNEYERLMDLWTDVFYLRQFAKDNNIQNIKSFIDETSEDAEDIQDFMADVEDGLEGIDSFFRPLHNNEDGFRILSLQKGKPHKKSVLRLYAIRIEEGIYLITGGGIKLVRAMQESEELMEELQKLKEVKTYLQKNGVFDDDSLQELKQEEDEN